MDYGKIKTDGGIEAMPNPYRVVVANPKEVMKAELAQLFGWLEMVYTDQPEYDPETQYITERWEEEDGKAVQHWDIHDIQPDPEEVADDE